MTTLPDDKFNIESLADPYRAEIAKRHKLLVHACCRIARMWQLHGIDADVCIEEIEEDYGIRLCQSGDTFEEDTKA